MKKFSHAISAIIALAFIALFLGLRLWASAKAVEITGPSAMKQGPGGSVYIMSNDVLYVHDKDGDLINRTPMSRFGVAHVRGDFWVYRNGDLLLRRDVSQDLTLTGEAELFARSGAGEQDSLKTGEGILERCSFATFQCRNFGEGKEVFDRMTAFGLMVDEASGITYLSDTIAHQLLMLDERGSILKRSAPVFQFPNHIVLDRDGLLYVADTNNHRLAGVSVEKEKFGTVEKEIRIVHPRNPLKLTWPMSLARAADETWWVINADNNMSYGMVMILGSTGAFQKTVRLPRDADPLRLLAVGDRVLITDPALMRVYTASGTGGLLDDFGSLTFKIDLSELRRERQRYEAIARVSMWALLVLLVVALVVARQSRIQQATGVETQAGPAPAAGTVVRRGDGTMRYDYHNLLGIYRIKFAVLTVMLVTAFVFFILISRGLTLFHKEFFPAALLAHFTISFLSYVNYKRSSIEITQQGITYQGMVRSVDSPWNGVRKIVVYGSASKIVTDHGNFSIGRVEPADSPPGGWLDLLTSKRMKYHKELIEEIQTRAPRATVSISWLIRRQWELIPSSKTAGQAAGRTGTPGVLEKSEVEQLNKSWLIIQVIWGALLGSLAVYLVVGNLLKDQLRPMGIGVPVPLLRIILLSIAIALFPVIAYIRKAILRISSGVLASIFAPQTNPHVQHPAAMKYINAIVVAMALAESMAVFGLVLFFLSKDILTLYLFISLSALAMIYYRPRKEELMQVALEMQKREGAEQQVQTAN